MCVRKKNVIILLKTVSPPTHIVNRNSYVVVFMTWKRGVTNTLFF